MEKNIIAAIYSAQAVQIAGNKDETALFDLAWRRPPLNFDLTWTRPLSKKRGLKSLEEEWPEAVRHDAKAKMSLESIFVSEARPSSSSASATPEVFRFDDAEQAVKYQVQPRKLRRHLAGLTWNAGSTRQGLDIASFVAGTWSYICLQEADASTLARLKACDYEVVSQGDLAVAMPRDFLRSRGQMVQVVERDCESGQWALRAIFARFDLKAPADWPVQHLVLGSCHLNNVVAREKRGLTRELLQELFAAARASGCDTLGVDFNQGILQLSEQLRLWVQVHNLEPLPTALLGHCEGDCCGFLFLPGSRLLGLNLQRHGWIPFCHRDVAIRLYDAELYFPCFAFHSVTNRRSRGEMSAARQDRRDRKKAKLEEKRGERKSRVWGGDLDRKQRTPVLVAKGAVEGTTAVLSNHDRATVAHQTVTAQHPDPSGGNDDKSWFSASSRFDSHL